MSVGCKGPYWDRFLDQFCQDCVRTESYEWDLLQVLTFGRLILCCTVTDFDGLRKFRRESR